MKVFGSPVPWWWLFQNLVPIGIIYAIEETGHYSGLHGDLSLLAYGMIIYIGLGVLKSSYIQERSRLKEPVQKTIVFTAKPDEVKKMVQEVTRELCRQKSQRH